jgi:signal peptidase
MPREAGRAIGYAELVKARLEREGMVDIPSSGISMFPVIRSGDLCRFVPLGGKMPKPGDILLFADREGRLIGHRLLRVEHGPSGTRYILKGDTNRLPDEAVEADRILGVLASITRAPAGEKPRTADANSAPRRWWGVLVRRLPGLSVLLGRLAESNCSSSVQPARRR